MLDDVNCEILDEWMQQVPVAGAAFGLNDPVCVVAGTHAGTSGSVISLLALDPSPRYLVELGSGEDIEAMESELCSAHVSAPGHPLSALQHWYARQTDGDWEHGRGVQITSLDNPGWALTVDLAGTALAGKPFAEITELDDERDWMSCRVSDGRFEANGGPFMLERMLRIFADWAQGHAAEVLARGDDR